MSRPKLFEAIKPELKSQLEAAQSTDECFELLTTLIAQLSGVLCSVCGAPATVVALETLADINRARGLARGAGRVQ